MTSHSSPLCPPDPSHFSALPSSPLCRVDMVLVGADAVVENGGIINKLGTYGIALAAQVSRRRAWKRVQAGGKEGWRQQRNSKGPGNSTKTTTDIANTAA